MRRKTGQAPRRTATSPTYALYGEAGVWPETDLLHCETIFARSRLHDFRIAPHRHERMVQMLFLASGDGTVVFDDTHAALPPPCVVLMPARVVHGYTFSNEVEGLVLTMHEQQVGTVLHACPEIAETLTAPRVIPLAAEPSAAGVVAASLRAIAAEFAGHAAGRSAVMQASLAIAYVAVHRVTIARQLPPGVASRRGAQQVDLFLEMIERDFRSRKPLRDYAARLGVTSTHLRRLCLVRFGRSPLAIVNQRCIVEAKRLLVFSTLSVKEVAAEIGFSDCAYFSRFFRREAGLAPTAFRATRQKTRAEALAPVARWPRRDGMPPATDPSSA